MRVFLPQHVIPSKTIPADSRPKWAKCIPVFRRKRRKNPTRWGSTYLYSLHKGVPLSPESLSLSIESKYISNVFLYLRSLRKEGYTQAEIHSLFQSLVIPNLTYGLPSTVLLMQSLPGAVLSYICYMGICRPHWVGFLGPFVLKTGIRFAHFGLELGVVIIIS